MRTVRLIAVALCVLFATATADKHQHDHNSESLQTLLQTSKFAFVIFHGHDCGYCDYLRELIAELSTETATQYPDLKFALINAEANEEARTRHSIQQYPVAKLFSGDTLFRFFIQRLSKEQIRAFIDDILSKKATAVEIATDKAFVKFNNLDYAVALSFAFVSPTEKAYAQSLQNLFPTIPVHYMAYGSKWDKLLFKDKSDEQKYRIYFKRDFDDGDKTFARSTIFDSEDIAATFSRIKDPKVQLLNRQLSDDIFSGLLPGLVIFDKDLNSSRVSLLTKVLLETTFHGITIKTNGTDDLALPLVTNIGITEEDYPALRIIGVGGGKVNKFKFQGQWVEAELKEFLNEFKDSKLTPYKKCAKAVQIDDGHVHIWNRDQYTEAREDHENVLVIGFTAKYCVGCSGIREVLEETRKLIKDKKSFVFGIVDLDYNDIDGVELTEAPVIQIIRGHNVRKFQGPKNASALADDLNSINTDEL